MEIPTITKLLEIINQRLKDRPISVTELEMPLDQAGLDSLDFIHVIVAIEKEYDCEIPDSKLIFSELNTVEKIYMLICSLSEEEL